MSIGDAQRLEPSVEIEVNGVGMARERRRDIVGVNGRESAEGWVRTLRRTVLETANSNGFGLGPG